MNSNVISELQTLRVSLARIAQACGEAAEREIPGCSGETGLPFERLVNLAVTQERGWNRLAGIIVELIA